MRRLRIKPLGLVVLLVVAASCTAWRPAPPDLGSVVADAGTGQLRVTMVDGRQAVVHAPRIVGDSLVSTERRCTASMAVGGRDFCREVVESVAALDDVASVEVRRIHGGRTFGAVLLTAGTFIGVVAASISQKYGGPEGK